jgi:hypothetical protein
LLTHRTEPRLDCVLDGLPPVLDSRWGTRSDDGIHIADDVANGFAGERRGKVAHADEVEEEEWGEEGADEAVRDARK